MGAEIAPRPAVPAILLAAGAGRRYGPDDKLLADIGGIPLIRRMAMAFLQAGCTPAIVVLPPDRPERAAALSGLDVTIATNPAPGDGMAASIRAGLETLPADADACLVSVADLPGLTPGHVRAVLAAAPADPESVIVLPVHDGRHGHPVLWGRRFFPDLMHLTGDSGGRPLLDRYRDSIRAVAIGESGIIADIDTPDDLARLVRPR